MRVAFGGTGGSGQTGDSTGRDDGGQDQRKKVNRAQILVLC